MSKKLCCIMSLILTLTMCLPGEAMYALAEEITPLSASQSNNSQVLQDASDTYANTASNEATVDKDAEVVTTNSEDKTIEAPSSNKEKATQLHAGTTEEQPTDSPDAVATLRTSSKKLDAVTVDGMVFTPVWDGNSQTNGYALGKYTGESTTLDIPAQITGSDGSLHPVTTIYQDLQGYKKIEHLTIPDSVTEIANSAFLDCKNLQTVKIGSGVTRLDWTFDRCRSLVDVTFSDNSSLKVLYNAFRDCPHLESLVLPDGLENVSLQGSSGLKEITLPSSVTKIHYNGFKDCTSLTSINIPDGVTALGAATFFNCPNLTAITGGANVTSIAERCFGGYDSASRAWVQDAKLTSLGDIDFSKLTSIGDYAFYGVENLPNQDLSLDSISSLGKYAFYNKNWITKVAVGDGLEVIPEGAFGSCYYIGSIVIPNTVKSIGKEAFKQVDAATIKIGSNNNSHLESIGENAFADQQSGSAITIHTARSNVNLKANSFGKLDKITWTVASVDETDKVIYLDGKKGNDSNDGSAKNKAVKTFARAKELATANQDIMYINVIGTTQVSGDVSLDGTHAMLRRDADFGGYLLQVTDGDTATLKDITVDGNAKKVSANRALILVQGATLNVQDGTILQNNKRTDFGWYEGFGGAIYVDGSSSESTVNMSGGIIQNNIAKGGGGISVDCGGTFNMTGGTISNNHALTGATGGIDSYAGGGGVALAERFDVSGKPMIFNFSGGTIEGNSSEDWGGGICLGWGKASHNQAILNMTGGTVQNNTAGSGGGGIFVQYGFDEKGSNHASYGVANISGGRILNNKMLGTGHGEKRFGGGGIYVNGGPAESQGYYFHNGELNLTNALITDNAAALEGGGYAACPVSETHIYVKDGVALYGNTGSSAQELYILASMWYGVHSGSPHYKISDSMLGGTPYNWKYDGGAEVPLNELEGMLSGPAGEQLSLHTDVTSDAVAQELANVIISGNSSATRGGGIGTNGTVTMGTSDEIEITVHKSWEDGGNPDRPQSVTVELYRTTEGAAGEPVYVGYETISPDKNGAWELTFKNLPKTDANGAEYVYSVKEHAADGYTALVSGNQVDGFEIKNVRNTSVSVTKKWDGPMGTEVSVKLLADGAEVPGQELILNDANGWSGSFDNLPKYDVTDGHEIDYTVSEANVSGVDASKYTVSVTGDATTGFTITNTYTHTPETISIPVTKKWVGGKGGPVTVRLSANGTDTGLVLELSESNDWKDTFTNLPKFSDGKEIDYSISEDLVKGYVSKISGTADDGFTVTNTKEDVPSKPRKHSKGSMPQTGDQNSLLSIGLLSGISLGILLAAALVRRRDMTACDDLTNHTNHSER